MMKLWRMVRVSRLLDDRKDRSRCPWPEMRDQERVDAELSDASMLPWERPTAGMRSRVLLRIEAKRYERPVRRAMPAWPLRVALAGAAALMLWATPWGRLELRGRGPDASGFVASGAEASLAPGVGAILDASEGGGVAVAAEEAEDPIRQEARAVSEDTRRAAEMVLGKLTIATGW